MRAPNTVVSSNAVEKILCDRELAGMILQQPFPLSDSAPTIRKIANEKKYLSRECDFQKRQSENARHHKLAKATGNTIEEIKKMGIKDFE